MNRISRRAATLGAAGLLVLTGAVGVAGHNAVHAAGPTTATQPARSAEPAGDAATDTDQVQQDAQSGGQQDLSGPDTAGPEASTAPDTDTIQSQSGADSP